MNGGFRERRFTTQDGLSLYFREYGDPAATALPVLCLAGIGRNSKDFHNLALHLAPARRVLALDYRGRGRSDYDPKPENYQPRVYINDILHLLTAAGIERVVVIGTSLGGILAMLIGTIQPGSLAGVVMNDIGPEMPIEGFKRIRSYIGKIGPQPDLAAATQLIKGMFARAFPTFSDAEWQNAADAMFRRADDGTYVLDYDPAISKPLGEQAAEPPKLWRFFATLKSVPTLALRGELSDVLSAETFDAMAKAKPDLHRAIIPNRGHTPTLDEPEARAAIDAFFASLPR